MKKLGTTTVALIIAGLLITGLAGALIATSLGDDDDDEQVVVTTSASPGAATEPTTVADTTVAIDPEDEPLTPAEANRVAKAAIRAAGGGTVAELDRSDDPGEAYEVEVHTDMGEVDIALDENLQLVSNTAYDD